MIWKLFLLMNLAYAGEFHSDQRVELSLFDRCARYLTSCFGSKKLLPIERILKGTEFRIYTHEEKPTRVEFLRFDPRLLTGLEFNFMLMRLLLKFETIVAVRFTFDSGIYVNNRYEYYKEVTRKELENLILEAGRRFKPVGKLLIETAEFHEEPISYSE